VNAAIDKGVEFLKKSLDGKAPDMHSRRLGGVALGTLTLLSCGVPENDPIVRKGIDKIRAEALDNLETYDVSLCILALDRLNDASDKPLIRTLALRLAAWQARTVAGPAGNRGLSGDDRANSGTAVAKAGGRRPPAPGQPEHRRRTTSAIGSNDRRQASPGSETACQCRRPRCRRWFPGGMRTEPGAAGGVDSCQS
jgi:hypothetical protein